MGRFTNPFPQFLDETPEVYAGGTLTFYASGTSTPLNTYTTAALSVANNNPITLDAAGRLPGAIFLQDLDYKVVLKDSLGNTIWTADPVSSRDSKIVAKTITGSGSPNGSVAGTAGSASILPDYYWDYTNSILYVCTTTGTSSTAVWTAINASSATPSVPPPQGRLTLTSATPVIVTGVTSGTAVYYTPYVGNLVPIYNGSSMVPTTFAELTLTLTSSHALNTIYDVFVFANSGVVTLVTGPAWTTSTAGAGARGSGASTTQLTRIGGLLVNAVAMTARNGSTTYSVGANLATFVGSIIIDGTAGQLTCHTDWGQSRKWGVSNAYNRVPVVMQAGDSTASWTYTAASVWRQSRATAGNTIQVFQCLAEEVIDAEFHNTFAVNSSTSTFGIGYNSTTAPTGTYNVANSQAGGVNFSRPPARAILSPALGINNVNCLEWTAGAGDFYGTQPNMNLVVGYRA